MMTTRSNVSWIWVFGLLVAVVASVSAQETDKGNQEQWGHNLIVNGSFEDGFNGWSLTLGARQDGEEVRSTLAIDTEVAHEGHSSLRLSGGESTTIWLAAKSDPVAVRGNEYYVLASWIRADSVKRAMNQYFNCDAFVQFLDADGEIVPIGKSPVRATRKLVGTQDWTRVSVVVQAPEGAVVARAGVALTCTGTAWFDEVAFFEATDVNWKTKETDRFVYYYEEGNEPLEPVIDDNERFLTSLEKFLGVKPEGKIRYYKYFSNERKSVLTGDSSASHYRPGEVHSLRWDEKNMLVGALLSEVGVSTPFLANGIAAYTILSLRKQNVHEAAAKMAAEGGLLSVVKLMDPQTATVFPGALVQAMSSSFVGYLVEQYGMPKFIRFYACKTVEESSQKIGERAQAGYGRSIEQLDRDWHEFLKTQ